ncbi:AMP-binding protein [Streptomyces litchfieldiae]|uniref:AMP-binding protein n=1 Tax=Streptomyces litchfieldiae TaxID=3075543 RepID=A0ABU2MQN5_9ACTN|nr:AMP-binding protein [Streptomyces sp. DSM 44938]MDT0343937.1 AMP-binding protein [Streptomyces sp. DSM 44938]
MTSPREVVLYDWFDRSVMAHPARTALEVEEHVLTYAELARVVRGLAGALVECHGGTAPRRVGLLAGRTLAAYAGYLAILCLGSTPVPLNVRFPPARNADIAAAAGLDLVISTDAERAAEVGTTVYEASPGRLAEFAHGPAPELPGSRATPDDFAYILFTSGSTGAPKGVPLQHRQVCAFLGHVIARYPAGPGARVSQVAELTFDPSVHDMFVAWGTGAALVVPSREEILAPVDFVNRRRLTHWFSVPSVISTALRLGELAPGDMPGLRWSLFSGEPLTWKQARAWQEAAPHSTVDNIYGPTEITGCYEYRLGGDPGSWETTGNGTVPIGSPYPGTEYLILDPEGKPAQEGELLLRGVQRFPGYLDPAQNSGRFMTVDDDGAQVLRRPFEMTDEIWYRTGDRVLEEDGRHVHLGRLDHQVKIRGHRVEVGEIEELIRTHDGIREAVVVAGEGADGERELRAACTGAGADTEQVLARLRERLPDYMIPRSLVRFDELPLNFNGKIDRTILEQVLFC